MSPLPAGLPDNLLVLDRQAWAVLQGLLREEPVLPKGSFPDVKTALLYINAHLFDPRLNANMVRAGCHVASHSLSTRFKLSVGSGIRDYIEERRLTAARRLLRETRLGPSKVAWAVGYLHYETFCRAFRRRFGETPAGCRKEPQACAAADAPGPAVESSWSDGRSIHLALGSISIAVTGLFEEGPQSPKIQELVQGLLVLVRELVEV